MRYMDDSEVKKLLGRAVELLEVIAEELDTMSKRVARIEEKIETGLLG